MSQAPSILLKAASDKDMYPPFGGHLSMLLNLPATRGGKGKQGYREIRGAAIWKER